MSNALLAHCDTIRADEETVRAIEAPEPTKTWSPIPHSMILDAVQEITNLAEMKVISREYSMNSSGTKMFGVWTLEELLHDDDGGMNKTARAIGFRSSTDKSMAVGICAGDRVFVCDNLCFSGQYIAMRKHTGGLDETDLAFMAEGAVRTINLQYDETLKLYRDMSERNISNETADHLSCEIIRRGILNPTELKPFLQKVEEYETTNLYKFFNAFTAMQAGRNLLQTADRTARCRAFMKELV